MEAATFGGQRGFEAQGEGSQVVAIGAQVEHFAHFVVIARMAVVEDALPDHVKLQSFQMQFY